MLCLRFDLDYVPWDAANAELYGHGEPAMVLKLLELARQTGAKFHFFVSNRSLRTFPTLADAILSERHDLDWLTHFPDDPDLFEEAKQLFALAGHKIEGLATSKPWPEGLDATWLSGLRFLTAPPGPHPNPLAFFPESGRFDEEVAPVQFGNRLQLHIDELTLPSEDGTEPVRTLVARPQILAKHDPQLKHLRLLLDAKIQIITLRDAIKGDDQS